MERSLANTTSSSLKNSCSASPITSSRTTPAPAEMARVPTSDQVPPTFFQISALNFPSSRLIPPQYMFLSPTPP